MALNKVMIIGNLGKDPEMRYTQGGSAVCNMAIATTEKWKDKQTGEAKEATEWHRVVFFGKQAEVLGEHTGKGSKLYVEGSLTTRKWQDKDGNDRWTTEIKGRLFEFLDSKGAQPGQAAQQPKPSSNNSQPATRDDGQPGFEDDDIPF